MIMHLQCIRICSHKLYIYYILFYGRYVCTEPMHFHAFAYTFFVVNVLMYAYSDEEVLLKL